MKNQQLKRIDMLNQTILGIKIQAYVRILTFLVAMTLLLSIWIDCASALRIVFGSVYTLILPGFLLSHFIFPKRHIDHLDRFAMSIALSISIVPIIILYTNMLGVKISMLSVITTILGICIISILGISIRKKLSK